MFPEVYGQPVLIGQSSTKWLQPVWQEFGEFFYDNKLFNKKTKKEKRKKN
jgi:hypothetical protein